MEFVLCYEFYFRRKVQHTVSVWREKFYLGYSYISATEEEKRKVELKAYNMPDYPRDGSIKIIDGIIVVKNG